MYRIVIFTLILSSLGFNQTLNWSIGQNTRAVRSCSGSSSDATIPKECETYVIISAKTIVQCPDGRQLRVYKSKKKTSAKYNIAQAQEGTIPFDFEMTNNVTRFQAPKLGESYFQGEITFQDSDAEYICQINNYTHEMDLIPSGDFENSEDYPSVGNSDIKTFKFDNYSGGGWCEKEADALIDPQTQNEDNSESIRCRDFNPETGNQIPQTGRYVSLDGYVGVHRDWGSDTWFGDGYSKLFPGGTIFRTPNVGYHGTNASQHTRVSLTKEQQVNDIEFYPLINDGQIELSDRYINQGRVEMVVSKLQDDQYRMEEGDIRWYGLSFKIQSDDVINSFTLDEGIKPEFKQYYLKNRVPVTAIISQLHNAHNKQAYFSIKKDPVNSKMYISFAHDISCPESYSQALYSNNPCNPDFEEYGVYDESVKISHYEVNEILQEGDYLSSEAFKYEKLESGEMKYYKVVGRTMRFNEYAIEKGRWYHIRYRVKAQLHEESPSSYQSITGRLSAQIRSDDGDWVDFKYRSPKAVENIALDRELYPEGGEGQESCIDGEYYESYQEPLENNDTRLKLRACNTQITEIPTFTHEMISKGSITKVDNNDIKFGWYGKSYPDENTAEGELKSTIIIDNVSAAPLKEQLKKPLREDIIKGYDFGVMPLNELASNSINFSKVNSGVRLDLTTSWNTMELLPQVTPPNQDFKEVKVELHASIPANHVSSFYHGNIQLLFGWDWVGQFDLWMDPSYFQYDPATGMYNYIVELNLPSFAANKINDENNSVDVRLAISSSNDLDHVILHSLNFIGVESLEGRDLTESLISHGESINVSVTGLKNSARNITQFGSVSSNYNIWYKTMVDPKDNVTKKFYYVLQQDVVYSMPGVTGWAQLEGYTPDVPWKTQSNSSWRQVWKYLGNEI